ncbi:flagellar protein FliT [Paenibacillus camerounensis]|uniref:flagellar protein FliT n=1 Tax=Paenibacillus camerounensis TaxID=1243663 RepID=UPI0005A88B1C|nr:flagellar protein FliT [Paenibacillus camerounensis]
MVDRLSALEALAQAMLSQLADMDYEKAADFVNQRELLTDQLIQSFNQNPPDADEQVKLREILSCDNQITVHMQNMKTEASQWLITRNQAKMQRTAYDTSYTYESILMDRKE